MTLPLNLYLRYNNQIEEVQPAPNKMTFYEELYTEAHIEEVKHGLRLKVQIHPKQDIVINELRVEFPFDFQSDNAIFCNGFQSQTESLVHSPNDSMLGLGGLAGSKWHQYGQYRHPFLKDLSANLHSWTYSYVSENKGMIFLVGSLAENTGFTLIKHCCNLNVIKINWEAHDFKLSHSFPAIDIVFLRGKESTVFDEYASLHPGSDISNTSKLQSCLAVDVNVSEKTLNRYNTAYEEQGVPINMVLVNDGFPIAIGDWFTAAAEAPKGIPAAAKTIHSSGLKAAIKVAPLLCSSQSDFFKYKKDCLLKQPDGQLVKIKHPAAKDGNFYVLDFYNKAVKDYLNSICFAITKQWSYDYISMDLLHLVCLYPPANKTMGQVMCEVLDQLIDLTKGTPLIANSVPLGAAFGRVTYCATAEQPIASWKSSWLRWNRVRERSTALTVVPTQINRRQLINRMFQSSPALLIDNSPSSPYSLNQQQTMLLANSLSNIGFICTDHQGVEPEEEQISEFKQATLEQHSRITNVSEINKHFYRIDYTNASQSLIAYLNLRRASTNFQHQGRVIKLESCESVVLLKS